MRSTRLPLKENFFFFTTHFPFFSLFFKTTAMSEPRYREWILDTIDSLRSRKARPDLDRICRMVRRRHGSEPDRTCLELEKLIEEQLVLKVNYKGSISYRNAAKVQRGKRKSEQAVSKSAAKRVLGPVDDDEMEVRYSFVLLFFKPRTSVLTY